MPGILPVKRCRRSSAISTFDRLRLVAGDSATLICPCEDAAGFHPVAPTLTTDETASGTAA